MVYGPHSSHVVQLLQHGGVSCKQLGSWAEYRSAMVVKLLWSCIFWLLSAGLGGATVSGAAAANSSRGATSRGSSMASSTSCGSLSHMTQQQQWRVLMPLDWQSSLVL